jgi:hypothetical protein
MISGNVGEIINSGGLARRGARKAGLLGNGRRSSRPSKSPTTRPFSAPIRSKVDGRRAKGGFAFGKVLKLKRLWLSTRE